MKKGDEGLPDKAFPFAHKHGLDFLAITDHHKGLGADPKWHLDPTEYKKKLYDVAMKYNKEHPEEFIAIPGFEWGTTKNGNHFNVFGASKLPPAMQDTDYKGVYRWASKNADFVQFNHPNSWKGQRGRRNDIGNFGLELYDPKSLLSELDPTVKTVSIICSVRGGHIGGKYRHSTDKTHRDAQWEKYYKKFLNKGLHIAPAANQDTHSLNWGAVTAARTAAWADSPSYEDLMKAFKALRVYATEDDEMAVVFQVQHKGQAYWMGDTVPLEKDEDDVEILVKIWQSKRSDKNLSGEGPYTISIVSDVDGIGGREAAVWHTVEGIKANELTSIEVPVVNGEYFYLVVTEENGQDNPIGDGIDEYDNETGEEIADNKRDDMNDSA